MKGQKNKWRDLGSSLLACVGLAQVLKRVSVAHDDDHVFWISKKAESKVGGGLVGWTTGKEVLQEQRREEKAGQTDR